MLLYAALILEPMWRHIVLYRLLCLLQQDYTADAYLAPFIADYITLCLHLR